MDWEAMAKNDLKFQESLGIDRNQTAFAFSLNFGYFQQLIAFMGFTEGLCAIQEEPEEVQALMEYLSDFYIKVAEKTIDLYKPDIVHVIDDTAAWAAPFMSVKQYRELFKPYHAKEAKLGLDRGLPVQMHNCGKCECFIDDWIDFGVTYWDPAQECNDLVGIQKKYGNKMIVVGGLDIMGELARAAISEADYKQIIIEKIDKYAKNNAFYILDGWVFGDPDDEVLNKKNRWLTEVVEDYGVTLYK